MARQNQGEQPDREFMICALDLISGIADGLGPSIESLIGNSNIVNLLFECMKVRLVVITLTCRNLGQTFAKVRLLWWVILQSVVLDT